MALYQPDQGAVLNTTSFVASLSQRDLALDIPINYVPVAGVALSAACFGEHIYDVERAGKCLSNLLVSRFLTVEVDVYWDTSRALWSLCPVQFHGSNSSNSGSGTSSPARPPSRTTSPVLKTSDLATAAPIDRRSASDPANAALQTPQPELSHRSNVRSNSAPVILSTRESEVVAIGNYSCSAALDFSSLIGVLGVYLDDTETDLNATLNYLILNVHAAASAASPSAPAPMPLQTQLPDQNSTLSFLLRQNLSSYLYLPSDLSTQRVNLNASGGWLSPTERYKPNSEYFNVTQGEDSLYTDNGWPGEGFIEQQNAKRLIVGYGHVDPQMSEYQFSVDAPYIFPPGYIQQLQKVSLDSKDSTPSNCFFDANDTSLVSANSSWAAAAVSSLAVNSVEGATQALIQCGFSPILNATLAGTSADQSFEPYQSFALGASIWSWADGEPQSQSATGQKLRCAALNITSGRWQARSCSETHHASCRRSNLPYLWDITADSVSFTYADAACAGGTAFDVPRTALQNRHLLAQWQTWTAANSPQDEDDLLWLNLNDLDATSCWVSQGANATCPYAATKNPNERTVVVPAVAALIILVIAALLLFVKCAANRRSSKRRRRRLDDGWDYEGVPL